MDIRNLYRLCAALAVGIVLLAGEGPLARAQESEECEDSSCRHGWKRIFSRFRGNDCDDSCDGCQKCRRCRTGMCNRCYRAIDPYYCDPRDTEMYSAQGYGVPVAVPLAPVVKHTYHYGWGVPSSRLIRVGARYDKWYPDTPFSQSGGRLPGGTHPMIYQPTDTTQAGFYHVHVPRWQRWGTW
jgi:hypothetical protein